MKKIAIIAAGLLLCSPLMAAEEAAQQNATAKGQLKSIEVNGLEVDGLMFQLFQAERNASATAAASNANLSDQQRQVVVLNELVNTILISQDAEKAGLTDLKEVKAALDIARRKTLVRVAVANRLRNNPIDDAAIQAAYDAKYSSAKPKEYKARHILLKTEQEARDVIQQLQDGADFAALAKEKSTGPSAARGGDLGWFGAEQMVPAFTAAVTQLEKGKFTEQPVQTQFGWHVIRLDDSRDLPAPSLEAVKPQLMNQLRQKVLQEYVDGLRQSATIKVNKNEG